MPFTRTRGISDTEASAEDGAPDSPRTVLRGDFMTDIPTTISPDSTGEEKSDSAAVLRAIFDGTPGVLEKTLGKIRDQSRLVRVLTRVSFQGRTPIMHAAIKGNLDMFNAVFRAMETRLTHDELKEALTTTARHDGESLLTAAAGGGNLLVFDRVVGLLDGKVLETTAGNFACGGTVMMDAARNGDLGIFKEIVKILRIRLTKKQALDMVGVDTEDDRLILTSAARSDSRLVVSAWAEVLLTQLPPKKVAEACTASLATCMSSPRKHLNGISALIAYGAQMETKYLIRLAEVCTLDQLKVCFIDALSSAENPFVPGMTLSVAFDDAAPETSERESRVLAILMETVDDVLLEVLERLPQTIRGFPGGVEGCAVMFEPEITDARPDDFAGPLTLAQNERQFTENFCVAPLVFEYLSHRFVSGLPDMKDTTGILGALSSKETERETQACRGQAKLYKDGLVSDGTLPRLMQGMGITASGADITTAKESGWHRMFSVTLLPGAQFVAVGILTKPMAYYNVAAVRLALDFIVHLTMLAVFTQIILDDKSGPLTEAEILLAFYVAAAILTELTEMWETPQEYAQDKWNWLDVASLLLLSSGLYVRIYGEGVDIGRVFYALSAPLVFSRFLFFAQILPRQGLVIQMVTIMLGEIVHFGVVMGVIMLGFTVGFLALLDGNLLTFGEVWLFAFKAMLGEVGAFDDASERAAYSNVVTILLVLYLIVMAVMLLNLLIAVLSTEHAKIDDRSDREFNVSKVRMIKLYRRVVDNDVMPAPFNLVQLAVIVPLNLVDRLCNRPRHRTFRRKVGVTIFWFVTGPILIFLGWTLWVVSVPHSMVLAWKGTNYGVKSLVRRVFCCCAVFPFHCLCTPIVLCVFWIASPIVGLLGGERNKLWVFGYFFRFGIADFTASLDNFSIEDISARVSVREIIKQAKGKLNVREIWEYLEDPTTPSSPAMRRDEQTRPSTVEHIRLLRNHLEAVWRDELWNRRSSAESADAAVEARIVEFEGKVDSHFQKLDRTMNAWAEKFRQSVVDTTEDKITKLEEKLDCIARKL